MKKILLLILLGFTFFNLFPQTPFDRSWNIKMGWGPFDTNSPLGTDNAWEFMFGYRLGNMEFGPYYMKTNIPVEKTVDNIYRQTSTGLHVLGGSLSYHVLPAIVDNERITGRVDLYAIARSGVSFVEKIEGYLPKGAGMHSSLGAGIALFPVKKFGLSCEYVYNWFTNNNTIKLDQSQLIFSLQLRSVFFDYDMPERTYRWKIKLSTIIRDSYIHKHGNITIESLYAGLGYLDLGLYAGVSDVPVMSEYRKEHSYTPTLGIAANFRILPIFTEKNPKFDLYIAAKAGGYYYHPSDSEIHRKGAGYTISPGVGASFFLLKDYGLFVEYDHVFSDFSFFRGNTFRTGILIRF